MITFMLAMAVMMMVDGKLFKTVVVVET